METGNAAEETTVVQLPAPTAWPMVLALGLALLLAGMVTSAAISLLGACLAALGGAGWFRQVLPVERQEAVAARTEPVAVPAARTAVDRSPIDAMHRKMLPLESFRISTGLKGGVAGGLAMTVPAAVFSLVKHHSPWYALNLLAAGGFVRWASRSDAFFAEFHLHGLLAGLAIHGVISLLVGLLYGAMLPMFPRKPIVTAGFLAPLLWTGLIYSTLDIVSPILNQRIDWLWFVISQIAFGLTAGFVINLHARVRTAQFQVLPFAVRAGLRGATAKPEEVGDKPR